MEMQDIRSSFEEAVFMYAARLKTEGIELKYLENDDEIPEIRCDTDKLRQVFLNILDNAAKHAGDGKLIEASIHQGDSVVIVRIRDYGPGIPEDEIPLVKKKFFKGSSKARGTGIGLAVCDEIVELHGGSLSLQNAEGGGTLVTVTLPVTE
jgi:signal transduction histidine kinase